jgi:hypothetical protein
MLACQQVLDYAIDLSHNKPVTDERDGPAHWLYGLMQLLVPSWNLVFMAQGGLTPTSRSPCCGQNLLLKGSAPTT